MKSNTEKMRIWRAKNPDKSKKDSAFYYQKNKSKIKIQSAKRYKDNPKKWREREVIWRKNNPEKTKEIYKRYRLKYPEKLIAKNAKYRKENLEKVKAENSKWYKEHPEWAREKSRKRRNQKLNSGGFHTDEEWQILKAQYNWTCLCCKLQEPFKQHYKFLTEDHIIPLKKGGSDNIENIQPLCLSCNDKKHTKIINFNNINI